MKKHLSALQVLIMINCRWATSKDQEKLATKLIKKTGLKSIHLNHETINEQE